MKNLIYTVSITHKDNYKSYIEMTKMLVFSIREFGKFKGDIIILTNTPLAFKNTKAKIIIVNIDPHNKSFGGLVRMKNKINFSIYHNIIYLDSDILCLKDISDLFCADKKLLYTKQMYDKKKEINLGSVWRYSGWQSNKLDREIVLYGHYPVLNSGIWCISSYLCNDFLKKWYNEYDSFDFSDQSSFNKLIYKRKYPSKFWGDDIVSCPLVEKQNNLSKYYFLHFCTNKGFKKKKEYMLKYFNLLINGLNINN